MTSLTKGILSFQLFYKFSFFFMKKDFKKQNSKSTLQIPFHITTVCFSLVHSKIEKRLLIVLFFFPEISPELSMMRRRY